MAQRLRILHFIQHGDTSGMFPQLAREHDRSRYQLYFGTLNPIWPDLSKLLDDQKVEWFDCGAESRSAYPLALMRLASFLRRERIDILHAHLFEPSVIGLQAAMLARTPYRVMTRHYSNYHTRIDKHFHVKLDQLCTRLSHRVIAVSRHTAEHMIHDEGASADKIRTIHNGIDFGRVRLSGDDAVSRVRREFNAEDAFLLLVVGRLHPEKGYEYLFEAMADIVRRVRRNVLLLIAGKGTFEEEFRARVRSLGIDSNVRFLGFRADIPDLMAASDLVVLPSVAEAFGLVLTEALYLGTPVVATRVGGIPEIVDDGTDGVLVPAGDSRSLADAIVTLLKDEGKRRGMAGKGRTKVIERFQFETMVRAYEGVYEELIREESAAHASSLSHHSNV